MAVGASPTFCDSCLNGEGKIMHSPAIALEKFY